MEKYLVINDYSGEDHAFETLEEMGVWIDDTCDKDERNNLRIFKIAREITLGRSISYFEKE